MANKTLYGANGKPIYGVGGKLVYGVELYYWLDVVATYTSYPYISYSARSYVIDTFSWGNGGIDTNLIVDPVGDRWGVAAVPDVVVGLSTFVSNYSARTYTWAKRSDLLTDTAYASGRAHSDGTWYFPLRLLTIEMDSYRPGDERPREYIDKDIRISPSAHVLAKVVSRFGDVIATGEATLSFAVSPSFFEPTGPNNYIIGWTPATKTLSIG